MNRGIKASSAAGSVALGFDRLLAFDDREAERAFRAALLNPADETAAWIGLAVANTDSPRRLSCFLEAAVASAPTAEEMRWIELLRGSRLEENEPPLDEWLNLAISSEDASIAISLLRYLLFRAATGQAHSQTREHLAALAEAFPNLGKLPLLPGLGGNSGETTDPQWSRLAAEQALSEGKGDEAVAKLRDSIAREFDRLESIQQVMPEATLSLGDTTGRLLRLLLDSGNENEATSLAKSLMELPRDSYSVENKWRRLERDKTTWVVARRALAEAALKRKHIDELAQLPVGFTSRDKAEWFFWQLIGNAEAGQDIDLWLAALRREQDGKDLLLAAETYLHWKDEGEWLENVSLPGVPSAWYSENPVAPVAIQSPFSSEGLITPLKIPGAPFALENWKREKVTLDQFTGEPLLIIFFLGGGCLHCVEQLTAFGPRAEGYAKAGIKMLAVSTDPVEILSETLSDDPASQSSFPIPIVSNEKLDVFRAWGAYDEFDQRAIHGTFLLDATGKIIWKETGNAPYMHADYLLAEAKRLLKIP